jgi:NAD(P)-dependent dehydrogenase (short-subunit alcohol dehydrogenase family)
MYDISASDNADYDASKIFSLNGKVSVIVGASGNLGRALALGLSKCGSNIVLVGRNKERLVAVKKDIEDTACKVSVYLADVTNSAKMARVAYAAFKEYDRIDVLINSQGINLRIPTLRYPLELWEKVINVNLKGTFTSCKNFGRYMIKQGSGKIVNISSNAGVSGYEWGYSAYASSKGGVDALTRTLAVEWAKYGINVNGVAPYFIITNMTSKFLRSRPIRSAAIRGIPMRRFGHPKDIVGAVIFLSSSASDWMTGQILHVDGGYTAH